MSLPKYLASERAIIQVNKSFHYHPPKDDQAERYELIRNMARELAIALIGNVPESRELSMALTDLENCVMHANAGIARNE